MFQFETQHGVSVSLERGSVLILEGPHGSGKTNLLLQILGYRKRQRGKVMLDGYDIQKLSKKQKKMFTESTGVFLHEPLLRQYDRVGRIIPRTLLEKTSLAKKSDVLVKNLSRSEQRLLDFLRVISKNPPLLILDNPLDGAADETSEIIKKYLLDMRKIGRTMIISGAHGDDFNFLNPEKILKLSYDGKNFSI